jgi:hypothetical protein
MAEPVAVAEEAAFDLSHVIGPESESDCLPLAFAVVSLWA